MRPLFGFERKDSFRYRLRVMALIKRYRLVYRSLYAKHDYLTPALESVASVTSIYIPGAREKSQSSGRGIDS